MVDPEAPAVTMPQSVLRDRQIVVCLAVHDMGVLQWHRAVAQALQAIPGIKLVSASIGTRVVSPHQWQTISASTAALSAAELADIAPAIESSSDMAQVIAQCDVLIDLTDNLPKGWASRRGVWRLLDGRHRGLAQPYPCIEDITAGLGGHLRLLAYSSDGLALLREARFTVESDYAKSFSRLYVMAASLLRQALTDVTHAVDRTAQPCLASDPLPVSSAAARWFRLQGKAAAIRKKIAAIVLTESWMIGIIDRPIHSVLDPARPLDIRWFGKREISHFLADPFGIPGSADRMLCEELDWKSGVGHITEIRLDEGAIASRSKVDFGLEGHLSFPFMFRENERTYCLVESCAARRCELFIDDGASGWRSIATLFDQVAVADPVIFRWDDRYWLAYTDNDHSPFDNLCLGFADRLEGPWTPHPGNPVKIDNRSARPAGTPFVHEGALYRPAQDCSRTYGGATAINRILVCTPTDFREETVRLLAPDPSGQNPHGLHTVSAWGNRTLVDGKRYVFNASVFLNKFARRFSILSGGLAGSVN